MEFIRLDKFLSNSNVGSRKEVKRYIFIGNVSVDQKIVKDSDLKINPLENVVRFKNEIIEYKKEYYFMLNKPQGVISATFDNKDKTVLDLIDNKFKKMGIFPVGRLDKDTEGLLILTNNGKFAHNSLSPKKHVAKTYHAVVSGEIPDNCEELFNDGIVLEDGYKCMPSKINVIAFEEGSKIIIEIKEGKFHQIKRMFKSVDCEVKYLKRIKFGEIELDENLELGQYRELNDLEMKMIEKIIK